MDISVLEDLGLTHAEIKVYITLLEAGSAAAGIIIEKSGLQNSVVHRALNSLIEKALISYVLEGKRRTYQATRPESFFDFIENKKKRFEQLLPDLKKKQNLQINDESATIYKGTRGITEVYTIMINTKGKEYNTFGGGYQCAERMGLTWWLNIHEKRVSNKLHSRQVFDETVRNIGGTEIAKKPITKIKYIAKEFAQFQETVIVGGERPYGKTIGHQTNDDNVN